MASRIAARAFSTTARRMNEQALKKETKRNPETMVRQKSRSRPAAKQPPAAPEGGKGTAGEGGRTELTSGVAILGPRRRHGRCPGRRWILLRYVMRTAGRGPGGLQAASEILRGDWEKNRNLAHQLHIRAAGPPGRHALGDRLQRRQVPVLPRRRQERHAQGGAQRRQRCCRPQRRAAQGTNTPQFRTRPSSRRCRSRPEQAGPTPP